jgi:hypothetical protein
MRASYHQVAAFLHDAKVGVWLAMMRCLHNGFDELMLMLIFFLTSWLGDWGSFGEFLYFSNRYNGQERERGGKKLGGEGSGRAMGLH